MFEVIQGYRDGADGGAGVRAWMSVSKKALVLNGFSFVLIAMILLLPTVLLADGIDLVATFSRTPSESFGTAIPMVLLLMIANYALNFVVIGLLTFTFTRFRWRISLKHSVFISMTAGLLTNPAWAMGTWFLG